MSRNGFELEPYDPWDAIDGYFIDYEYFFAGGVDEPPSVDHLSDWQRQWIQETEGSYIAFLEWKYSDGLAESVHRHSNDPELFRSQFRLIRGGLESDDLSQP